ncbi:glutamyl aminopeptidase isoform X2 [Anoplophora glabripennis]|uniref:glutamyl aminopeptidase isoform X2 n=1 Tax=Anoplophora glabripennis TaxID=217634 RepID=UPI0008747F16|nr:glutamyl aminopeptidase isoform X2 [Anoplophora glabripennis]
MSLCASDTPRKKPSKTVAVLLSCCLCLLVICACLITALVFVGRHILYNQPPVRYVPRNSPSAPVDRLLVPQPRYQRLPRDTKPVLYDLTLLPDLAAGKFEGWVNITINVSGFRKDLVIHSSNLTINEINLVRSDATELRVISVNEVEEDQVLIITTREKILPDVYHLFIGFEGGLKDRLTGFYRSEYGRSGGAARQIATSKFEPTYARQAFPCFDEPNLKAKYIVHLLKPKDASYIALSNYPVARTEDYDDNNELVTFDETVEMSTYLSCFIVSDFTNTETSFDNMGTSVPLKVYASPENLNKTTYAGEVGKKAIEYYVNYFNMSYPLPKLDMVAIPDFVSGAMEHWGLVTYRETALLYTSDTHSSSNKQRVATVVAHELAHSWFGNLVTMDWWNDLWLNEGFASYIEYKGVLAAEPTWGMLDQFLVSELHTVLSLDATLSSHPIVQTVLTPDQITEIFDTISYNKGASILRMLENTVGEENFQLGVTNYLNKYAYSNAVTSNFLTEIQEVVGSTLDVAQMMDTFTVQMGYPVLTVSVNGDNYTLTQKRFLKDPDATYDSTESSYGYKWTIPVTYVTDLGQSTELILFQHDDESLTIQRPEGATWLKFNYDQIGYYRVNYPVDIWNSLISIYDSLSVSDRTHLVEESFSIAEAGLLSYEVPLELTKNIVNEIEYPPWSVASSKLQSILKYLTGSESAQAETLKTYVQNIVDTAYHNFTWIESEDDSHLRRLARVQVLTLSCAVGHSDCLSEVQTQFNAWINNGTSLSQDLRTLVYRYGIKNENEETWEKLLSIYEAESDASEKLKLVYGLANVDNTTLLSRMIELCKNESIVRSQDYWTVMGYISTNTAGTSLVWDWVRANWEYLVERFTLNNRYLGSFIPTITSSFATQERLTEMQEFFALYPDAGAGTANRAKALETVENNIRWLASYKTTVETWIAAQASTA